MAERERSRLRRLDMTGTDERRNSRSRSGTPSRGDNFVPQPVFQSLPGSRSHSGTPQDPPVLPLAPPTGLLYAQQMQGVQPAVMGDPFRIYAPEHPGILNLNDDMPGMQNAPQWVANVQGPLSQEGRHFQWQLPVAPIHPPIPSQPFNPPVPSQAPAQIVGGARHASANRHTARQPHPRYPTRLWCTKSRHWVESAIFGRLSTCEACRTASRARAAQLRNERLAQEAQVTAQLQLAAQIDANGPQNIPVNIPPPPPPPPPYIPPVDPLSAISPEDKILLENCRNKLMSVMMESCNLCHEEWFDLDVENGACANCRKSSKFQPVNNLMVILDLRHLHGKVLILPGFQLYLQLHDGRPKLEKL